ncbi:MAG TPA: 4a-hydroxytetrahydrobiopterin dehydratase [Bryobacteraceae bacterium]|nr:4a-hydroxytetrahydrobiopterin dehydratase [Bryobacteraceae bacterium]
MCELADRQCVPCRGGVPPLEGEKLAGFARQVPGWQVIDGHHIERRYEFPDFAKALAFVNRIGEVAEEQGHHPDLFLTWGEVRVKLFTHKINGLSESDFILAAKIDRLSQST